MTATLAIADLVEAQTVDATFAVARKQRLRTRQGADYLALELANPSGRIEARVWGDVDLLDTRFSEGDAVRVLARVERFRSRLQLDVRTLERVDVDASTLAPTLRRDLGELDGFLEFLAAEVSHSGLATTVARALDDENVRAGLRALPASLDGHHGYSGGLLEHTVAVATICRDLTQLHPRLRSDILIAAVGRALMVRGDWIKEGAIVIDVGINRGADGKLVGDVAYAEASQVAGAITPVPGGVGPMTIACLLDNTLIACRRLRLGAS